MADNVSSNGVSEVSLFSYGERVTVAVIILIIFVLGTLGNGIVILAVVLSRELQNITNVFVVSLAVADLCYCLLLPFGTVIALLSENGWPWDTEMPCSLAALVSFSSGGATLYNLACIALNRLLLIRGPAQAFVWLFTPRKTVLLVVSTWVIPLIVVFIPPLFDVGDLGYDPADNTCSDIDTHPRSMDYHLIQFMCMYPVPLATIVASYTLLCLHIKHHFQLKRMSYKASHKMSDPEPYDTTREMEHRFNKRTSRQQLQITKNLFMVSVAFVVLSAPYSLALTIPHNGRALLFLSVPFTFNSCVNPLLYTVNHPRFKVVIGCILRCRFINIPKPSPLLGFFLALCGLREI